MSTASTDQRGIHLPRTSRIPAFASDEILAICPLRGVRTCRSIVVCHFAASAVVIGVEEAIAGSLAGGRCSGLKGDNFCRVENVWMGGRSSKCGCDCCNRNEDGAKGEHNFDDIRSLFVLCDGGKSGCYLYTGE